MANSSYLIKRDDRQKKAVLLAALSKLLLRLRAAPEWWGGESTRTSAFGPSLLLRVSMLPCVCCGNLFRKHASQPTAKRRGGHRRLLFRSSPSAAIILAKRGAADHRVTSGRAETGVWGAGKRPSGLPTRLMPRGFDRIPGEPRRQPFVHSPSPPRMPGCKACATRPLAIVGEGHLRSALNGGRHTGAWSTTLKGLALRLSGREEKPASGTHHL